MTPPLDFEAAKQKVAEKHKFTSWQSALRCLVYDGYLHNDTPSGMRLRKRDFDKFIQMESEAADLLAQSWANHYASLEREKVIDRFPHPFRDEGHQAMLRELPLPFPEES